LEHSSHVFPLFSSIVKDVYINGMTNCKEIKKKYFKGRFNNDLLLKFMILKYDPRSDIRKCIIAGNKRKMSKNNNKYRKEEPFITLEYLEELRTKGPKEIRCRHVDFLSRSSLEFIANSDRKIKLFCLSTLPSLFKKLKEFGILEKKPLKDLLEPISARNIKTLLKHGKNMTDEERSHYKTLIN